MEKILNRLSDLILMEMDKKGCSCMVFADLCGISRNEMYNIVNRKKRDIMLSTLWRICENSDISMEDIFVQRDISDVEIDDVISKFFLTNGKNKYYIRKC